MQLESLNKVLGITLHLGNDQVYGGRCCLLSKKGDELTIDTKKVIEGSLTKVIEALPKGHEVALCLTGKGIIHKTIKVISGIADNQYFQEAFPSVDRASFYVQQFVEGENALVSMIRKEVVDDLLDKLARAGLKVYTLSLGGIVAANIWSQLNLYDRVIQFDGHEFHLSEEKKFLSYKVVPELKSSFPIKIYQEVINEESILAYAAAFQLILHQKLSLIVADVVLVNERFEAFIANGQLKKKAFIFLVGLFGLLLLSFVLFTHYNQENAKLVQQVGAQTANVNQTDLLKKNIASNEYLLKQLNWNGGYNYGFILNEIGKSMPRQLSLQEVAVNEFKTENEKLERNLSIKILGSTDNLTAVNNWIFVLKEKSWIKSAKLLKYQEDPESTAYHFSLIISF